MTENSFVNPPNDTNTVTVGCDCSICTLEPFGAGIGEYTKEDMNAVFKMLVGECTTPALAQQMGLGATWPDHEKEAFAISSAIFNRAAYDKALIEKKNREPPVKWGFMSDGTPLGVANSGKVVAYINKHHEKRFNEAKKLDELKKDKNFCKWIEALKAQAEKAAKEPNKRARYTEWRKHNPAMKNRTKILNTDLWWKTLGYPELITIGDE